MTKTLFKKVHRTLNHPEGFFSTEDFPGEYYQENGYLAAFVRDANTMLSGYVRERTEYVRSLEDLLKAAEEAIEGYLEPGHSHYLIQDRLVQILAKLRSREK